MSAAFKKDLLVTSESSQSFPSLSHKIAEGERI
jgi:hypothetical protein